MNNNNKIPIKYLKFKEIEALFNNLNQKPYRVKQFIEWLYKHHVYSFSEMSNLPKSVVEYINDNYTITFPNVISFLEAKDGTKKFILESQKYTGFNLKVSKACYECVGIPSLSSNRLTVCVSSQAGCPIGCKFCATGQQGFNRNLFFGEIIDQILCIQKYFDRKITNVVFMGQGEPFLNFDNVSVALNILNSKNVLNIASRKITVSTCGLYNKINDFIDLDKQFVLAISLHSTIQEKRNLIMPGVKNYNLMQLRNKVINYIDITNRRVSFEYLLIRDFNDTEEDLKSLIKYCKGLICHINLININPIPKSLFYPSKADTVDYWVKSLESNNISVSIRKSRGSEINAACGQLLNYSQNKQ